MNNRMFGKAKRFQPGRTFIPRACGTNKFYLPNDQQVGGVDALNPTTRR